MASHGHALFDESGISAFIVKDQTPGNVWFFHHYICYVNHEVICHQRTPEAKLSYTFFMNILVLDTIHGGAEIACHLISGGHHVDTVDIYRGKNGITETEALNRDYDLVIAPVHMDPDHPLLRYLPEKTISHHEAVAMISGSNIPHPMIEITGMQGKTTTAYALAHILKGKGVLHTSGGTWEIPEKKLIWKKSITPASKVPFLR